LQDHTDNGDSDAPDGGALHPGCTASATYGLVPRLPAAFLATMLAKLRVQGFFSPSLEGGLLLLERLLLNLNDPHPVFYQFGDQSNHCFFAFYVCSMYFFSTGQAQRFHVLILIDLHNFVNGKVQRLFMPEQLPIKLDKKWRSNR
jgi:hypothetical protein